jgi:hypothetical protein
MVHKLTFAMSAGDDETTVDASLLGAHRTGRGQAAAAHLANAATPAAGPLATIVVAAVCCLGLPNPLGLLHVEMPVVGTERRRARGRDALPARPLRRRQLSLSAVD